MPAGSKDKREIEGDTETAASSTRDHLVKVGVDLLRRHGYGATGLQEILKAANVPKGSFYHHFRSKEDFAVAVLNRYVKDEEKHCCEVFGNTRQAPLKRLRRYFEDLILAAGQTAAIPGCLIGGLSLEMAGSSPLLQQCVSESFEGWQAAITSLLREAIERGDLPKSTKPDSLAGFILNSWEGALLRSQADRGNESLEIFLHFIFEKILVSSKA